MNIKSLLFIVLSMCASMASSKEDASTIYAGREGDLETSGDVRQLFHAALYYPRELVLQHDGYLIGIEKADKKIIANPKDIERATDKSNSKDKILFPELLQRVKGDDKLDHQTIQFISHILSTIPKDIPTERPQINRQYCYLYSAYYADKDVTNPLIPCKSSIPPPREWTQGDGWALSWKALALLEEDLNEAIKLNKYSHIILMTMGWNTDQEEAIRNFNSIVGNLKDAANQDCKEPEIKGTNCNKSKGFKPLIIGVTWPSLWKSAWVGDKLVISTSFFDKSYDADEVGVTWISALIHNVLSKVVVENKIPLVVIGHSFGARATSIATCNEPFIKQPKTSESEPLTKNTVSLLIGLQGAYPIKRFFGSHEDEAKRRSSFFEKIKNSPNEMEAKLAQDKDTDYISGCPSAKQIVLTATPHDEAVSAINHSGLYYVGNYKALQAAKSNNANALTQNYDLQFLEVDSTGNFKSLPDSANSKTPLLYIDAKDLIKYKAYRSGGGAHSDIYRIEMGTMIWNLIKKYIPEQPRV